MAQYSHLTLYEREVLYALRLQKKSFRQIGMVLGRHHTTLAREYARNQHGHKHIYVACTAHRRANRRASKQRYQAPLKNCELFLYVREKLRLGWSPELIAGGVCADLPGQSIHHETIYRYIYNRKKTRGMKLYQYLILHRKRRMKKHGRKVQRTKIVNPIRIDQRDSIIDSRLVVGHWESDNMEGLRSDTQVVSALVERKTRYTVLSLLEGKGARVKTQATIDRLSTLHPNLVKSITTDNGSENAFHQELSSMLSIPVYLCYPYRSWEKGSVENTIGRLRRYIPKKTSLQTLTVKRLAVIEQVMNNTPRKCLGFKTPLEAINDEIQSRSN